MSTIAAITGIGRGDVPRSVRRLEENGLLRREGRTGASAVNLYILIFDSGRVSASRLSGVSNAADRVSATPLTGCQQIRTGGVSTRADLTDKEQTKRTHFARKRAERVDNRNGASEFETFWCVYPSRHPHPSPKKPARLKFEVVVKRGVDPADIIRGAQNYAAYVAANVSDPRLVAQAVTWLNQERWNDHQEAPEPPRLRVGMN
jgi:hypothetical protein